MAYQYINPTPGWGAVDAGVKTLDARPVWDAPDSSRLAFDARPGWSTPETLPPIPQTSEELNALTWEEIAALSAAAAKNPSPFLFMTDADHKLEKDIDLSKIEWSTNVKARIIGVGQDVDENGNRLGFTFQICDGISPYNSVTIPMNMNDRADTTGGWGSCAMRRTNLPKIEAAFPDNLKIRLKTIKKKTNMTYSGFLLTETTDRLALLSSTEVFGDDQPPNLLDTPWCNGEGEWYQWYKSHNENNDRIIRDSSGIDRVWWLRSVFDYECFVAVVTNGNWNKSQAYGNSLAAACFCV